MTWLPKPSRICKLHTRPQAAWIVCLCDLDFQMKCKIYFDLKTTPWTTEQQSSSFSPWPSFSSEMARRIFDLSNALHVEQVQNILLADETDPLQLEDLGEESDIASEDDVEECPDVSDTDQDGESEEDAQDIETYYFSGY
ncbi:uncharacterized protein LOC143761475 [Ranitomeya variabilis]|uniref:uncharacterized protein LOC143761475 n=1 Tax=Ranitomeya variabilis TaxID=490064 RepID=UPI00405699E1